MCHLKLSIHFSKDKYEQVRAYTYSYSIYQVFFIFTVKKTALFFLLKSLAVTFIKARNVK